MINYPELKLTQSIKKKRQGFTLIEMLISIVLSSIIFISSYQVISNLIQYQVRVRVQHEGQLDKLLIRNIISQIIEKSLHQYDLYYRTHKEPLFRGASDSIQLISRAYSEHFDKPGYRVYQLYQHDGELHVAYRKYDEAYLSNRQFELSTELKTEQIYFEYLIDGAWLDEWLEEDIVPQYIRISIDLPGSESMQWIRETGSR